MCICNPEINEKFCDSEICKRAFYTVASTRACGRCGNYFDKEELKFDIGSQINMCKHCFAEQYIFYLSQKRDELTLEINSKNKRLEEIDKKISDYRKDLNA